MGSLERRKKRTDRELDMAREYTVVLSPNCRRFRLSRRTREEKKFQKLCSKEERRKGWTEDAERSEC